MSATICDGDCRTCLMPAMLPEETDFTSADGVFVKRMVVAEADTYLGQHAHRYDHVTVVATGTVRLWEGETDRGEFRAPAFITIKAGALHRFRTLEPATVLLCIHNVSRTGAIETVAENIMPEVI